MTTRYTVLPLKHEDIWAAYKKQIACFWTVEEIDFTQDMTDWSSFSKEEKSFILHILAFFAVSDSVVLENLVEKFCGEASSLETKCFYTFQAAMESIHAETYSVMLEKFCESEMQRDKLFDAVRTMPTVASKVRFAERWMSSERPYAERVVAFAVVEGLLFSASFASIFWVKHTKSKMPGLCYSNELISRDEGMHCDFAVLLFTRHVVHSVTHARVREIIEEGLQVEIEFVDEALPEALMGMNKEMMKEYVLVVANRLCRQLIGEPLRVDVPKNPLKFMDMLSLSGKTNFFEKRVSEYHKSGVLTKEDKASVFDFEEGDMF